MTSPNTLHVEIDGMHCDACVRRLSKSLGALPGVTLGSVVVGSADVTLEGSSTAADVHAAIEKTGFHVKSAT